MLKPARVSARDSGGWPEPVKNSRVHLETVPENNFIL